MSKGTDRKSNPALVGLIHELKAAGRENEAPIWRDIALRLERPSRNWAQVNVSKLVHVRDGEHAIVPGKLLGTGDIVPADLRLIVADEIKVAESALHGRRLQVLFG